MKVYTKDYDKLHDYGNQLVQKGWHWDEKHGGYICHNNTVIFVTEDEQNKGNVIRFNIDYNESFYKVRDAIENAIDDCMDIDGFHICFCDKDNCPKDAWEAPSNRCPCCLLFLSTEFKWNKTN